MPDTIIVTIGQGSGGSGFTLTGVLIGVQNITERGLTVIRKDAVGVYLAPFETEQVDTGLIGADFERLKSDDKIAYTLP